jgi:hypothetical protein
MNQEWKQQFFEALEQHFGKITQENALEKRNDGSYVLRNGFTTLKDGKGIVLYEAEMYELKADLPLYEITVIPNIELHKEQIPQLEQVVGHLNYYAPLGAFGIYYPGNKLFLRYVALLDQNKTIQQLTAEVGIIYEILGGVMGDVYAALEQINQGKLTFDEAVEQKLLLRQK